MRNSDNAIEVTHVTKTFKVVYDKAHLKKKSFILDLTKKKHI